MSQCSACHVSQSRSNSFPMISPSYRMVPWQWCELQDWREVGSPGRKWSADELHVSREWKGRIQVWPPYVILMVSRHLSTLTFLTEPKHPFTGWAGDGGFVSVVVGKSVACSKSESWLNVMSKHFGAFTIWALWSSAAKCYKWTQLLTYEFHPPVRPATPRLWSISLWFT